MNTQCLASMFLSLALLAAPALAQDAGSSPAVMPVVADDDTPASNNLYRIDLLVFENTDPQAEASEQWQPPKELPVPARLHLLQDPAPVEPGAELAARNSNDRTPYLRLRDGNPVISAGADRMRRSRYYRVLVSASWYQRIANNDPAEAVVIRGGNLHGQHYELEGTLQLWRETWLHAKPQLWLTRFGNGTDALNKWPALPVLPGSAAGKPDANEVPQRIVYMSQDRRLRSNEIHYIDSPLFGVVIRISPAEPVASAPATPGH